MCQFTSLLTEHFDLTGSDPRTITCYGQGPNSGKSDDETGRQLTRADSRGHGFKCSTGLNFFQALFLLLLK